MEHPKHPIFIGSKDGFEVRAVGLKTGAVLIQFRANHAQWGDGPEAWLSVPVIPEAEVLNPWRDQVGRQGGRQ